MATTSDHEVIIFGWAPPNAVVSEREMKDAQNWNIVRLWTSAAGI
jgi:hypothetical protein